MIDDRDRSQLLRMAGNIAGGLIAEHTLKEIPKLAAKLALETLQEVDKLLDKDQRRERFIAARAKGEYNS